MGLDIVSDDGKVDIWHGAYTAFMRFRAEIAGHHGAKQFAHHFAGWAMPQVITAETDKKELMNAIVKLISFEKIWELPEMVAEQKHIRENQPALWTFMAHADDEGEWDPAECKEVISVIEAVLGKLPQKKDDGHIGDWKAKATAFIDGLKYCVKNDQSACFC